MTQDDPIETLTVEDPHTSGYCALPKYHLSIKPQLLLSNRVGFEITGPRSEIRRAFDDLANNSLVGSRDLIENIKRMRHLMFQAKAGVLR